jgi:hypothetical protein
VTGRMHWSHMLTYMKAKACLHCVTSSACSFLLRLPLTACLMGLHPLHIVDKVDLHWPMTPLHIVAESYT